MALKSFQKDTLNDNWYEERQSPLNGVVPYDGPNDYSTTNRSDFASPNQYKATGKARMVNEATIAQGFAQTTGVAGTGGFRSTLPLPDKSQQLRHLDTTHRTAFQSSHSPSSENGIGCKDNLVPAGGPGGRAKERGRAASGCIGEKFKANSDPQRDTASQRAWMYTADPAVVIASQKELAPSNHDEATSREERNVDYKRKPTSITTVPRNHTGVFMDD